MGRCASFITYESQRFITLKNWKLAVTFRTLQLGIIAYIVAYQIVIKEGYNEYDSLIGTTSTKVKGVATAGTFQTSSFAFADVYDLIPDPVEVDALFIMTNYFVTYNQSKQICLGSDKSTESCSASSPCFPGNVTANGVIASNQCVSSSNTSTSGYCNIYSWCPLEVDNKNPTARMMSGIDSWTIYLKVNIYYPNFGVALSNTFNTSGPNNGLVSNYNLFYIRDLLVAASTSYASVRQLGTIVLGRVDFSCDLNQATSACAPTFYWNRLDTDSPGFNYRYTVTSPGQQTRDLVKAFGIRFVFDVYGTAKKFSIVPLLVAIGSGVGLLSVATLVCDFMLQKFLPDKDRYLAEKFQEVAERGLPEMSATDVLAVNELANSRHLTLSDYTNGHINEDKP